MHMLMLADLVPSKLLKLKQSFDFYISKYKFNSCIQITFEFYILEVQHPRQILIKANICITC